MELLPAVVFRAATVRAACDFRTRSAARWAGTPMLILACLVAQGCLIFRSVEIESVDLQSDRSRSVNSPVKAHLLDGRTVVFPHGGTITPESMEGYGEVYDLRLDPVGIRNSIPLDSVVGIETFRTNVNVPGTVLGSAVATVGVTFATGALAVAIFGSCPTFYVDSAGTPALQGEAFSYSIAPLFEVRDVDRLRAVAVDGRLGLEVRNEALETHYINHLELIEARHAGDERVVPDQRGQPLALSGFRAAEEVSDAEGRDISTVVRQADGSVFASAPDRLRRAAGEGATRSDLRDHIDLMVPASADADSVAIVLRLRNSLLATTLLYDLMLKGQGAASLDWIGQDLERIGTAVELGRWYTENMGLRVSVYDGTGLVDSGTLFDTGPIAFKDVALVVPVLEAGVVRVRLDFVTDNWRIDHIAIAEGIRRPAVRYLPLDDVLTPDGLSDPVALALMSAPDEDYLQTQPGQRFDAIFRTGIEPESGDRTFLVAAQGYYIEWVRGSWLTSADPPREFVPGEAALRSTLARWHQMKDDFEARFHASRIPVR